MSPANINTTSSSSQSQFTKENIITALQSSDLKNPEKIADAITKKLTKGTGTEEDIFQAASELYDFKGGKNLALIAAIDTLNSTKNVRGTNKATTATWENFVSSDGDSRNMVKSSIEEIKKINTEFTVDDIRLDLEKKGVVVINRGVEFKNLHLFNNLLAMGHQGVTREDIIQATNSDEEWSKLLETVKKTEFQRQLIQDSIKQIKKTEFTVDDIIKSLRDADKLNGELQNNLTAMKTQGFTGQKIIEATQTDLAWNTFIGTMKKPSETAP